MNDKVKNILDEMSCEDNSYVQLKKDDLKKALLLKGDRLFLKLTYSDLKQEFNEKKIKNKLLEALSISIYFEDDGYMSKEIKQFVKYLHENTQKEQHLQFGIKKVDSLSKYPIKILFSAILPINQLEIIVEKKFYDYVELHRNELEHKFKQFRKTISKEIHIPILPLKHYPSDKLKPYTIKLIDSLTQKTICECNIESVDSDIENIIDTYILKLYKVYLTLCYNTNHKKPSYNEYCK